jgi:putative flippase GtrA
MNVESSILFYRVLSIVTAILYMNVCLYLGNDILLSSIIAVIVSIVIAFIRYLIRGEINE